MIKIKHLDRDNIQYINMCDESFPISSYLTILYENGQFSFKENPIPSFDKQYESTKVDADEYLNNPDKTIIFCFYNKHIAGQVILEKHWNNYVWLEIAVRREYRRKGIGRTLIKASIEWSKSRDFPGIMLETQNNNVPACHFYKACGFKLGGIDTELYKGINPNNDEIAMFWYYRF